MNDAAERARKFRSRQVTFGLAGARPVISPYLPLLTLLLTTPRVYEPLALGWESAHKGTMRMLSELVDVGLVSYQPEVVVNTATGTVEAHPSRKVPRWRITASGARLLAKSKVDIREIGDRYPYLTPGNTDGVLQLLAAFDAADVSTDIGLSAATATTRSGRLPDRTARWWIRHLTDDGHLKRLPTKIADTRAVIPAHWRANRALTRQLSDVLNAYPKAPTWMSSQLRLSRSDFLTDITPARVGASGATDYDHDVRCQLILGLFLPTTKVITPNGFQIEPRFMLPIDTTAKPVWTISGTADTDRIFYQPDAVFRERVDQRTLRVSFLEYERFQSRRDAWSHIERCLGYVHNQLPSYENVALRFVVESPQRTAAYVALIEAFADYLLDHPNRRPVNEITLMVSDIGKLNTAPDPLNDNIWYRITLPSGTADSVPVLHSSKHNAEYGSYFS